MGAGASAGFDSRAASSRIAGVVPRSTEDQSPDGRRDSAPTRNPARDPVFGSIDFAAHRYSIDFWRAVNHRLLNSAYVRAVPVGNREPVPYAITLGDSSSVDEKIVMIGRAVTSDSIVGTWTETIVCCSAGGRFSLWRSRERPAPPSPRGVPVSGFIADTRI
jgi:hypothetical protein